MSRPTLPGTPEAGTTRLRQIALVARDLKKAEELLTKVIGTEVIYVDPGVEKWGLKNILVAIGGEVIEVVSPFKPGTTAGRQLDKRGDGGYMIIMQTIDAKKRKEHIESKGLAKVIYTHESKGSYGVQYHPKGILGPYHDSLNIVSNLLTALAGGVLPELDSHEPTEEIPKPVTARFSPWYPCGPDANSYLPAMKKYGHLSLLGAVCRVAPGQGTGEEASRQWEQIFGVARSRDLLAFTNARVGFITGHPGEQEGIVRITIGVVGQRRIDGILERAEEMGVLRTDGSRRWVDMIGVEWNFSLTGEDERPSKL